MIPDYNKALVLDFFKEYEKELSSIYYYR